MTTREYCDIVMCSNYALQGISYCAEHINHLENFLDDCKEVEIGRYWRGDFGIDSKLKCSLCNKFFAENPYMYRKCYEKKSHLVFVAIEYNKSNIICKSCYKICKKPIKCRKCGELFSSRNESAQHFRDNHEVVILV